jgi:hypothetical protein
MEIWHRVALNTSKQIFADTVRNLGIPHQLKDLPSHPNGFMYFDIKESDAHWSKVAGLISEFGASDVCDTFFDDDEIRKAEWVRLISAFEQGYPQPKSNWPLKQLSYENICQKCGIYDQIASLRLQKEPHLGKKSFMSLIAVGEILCTSEVISALRDIHANGFDAWNVKIHKTDVNSTVVQQLYIPGIMSSAIVVDNSHNRVTCPICNTTKYYSHMNGSMRIKSEALLKKLDFMKTSEWFGSGLIAFREILISNRIACLILDQKWKGLRLKPVELV